MPVTIAFPLELLGETGRRRIGWLTLTQSVREDQYEYIEEGAPISIASPLRYDNGIPKRHTFAGSFQHGDALFEVLADNKVTLPSVFADELAHQVMWLQRSHHVDEAWFHISRIRDSKGYDETDIEYAIKVADYIESQSAGDFATRLVEAFRALTRDKATDEQVEFSLDVLRPYGTG